MYSGIGGWAGIGVAAGIGAEDPTAGLGALGAFGDAGQFSNQGGVMTVFGLKNTDDEVSGTREAGGVPSGPYGDRLRMSTAPGRGQLRRRAFSGWIRSNDGEAGAPPSWQAQPMLRTAVHPTRLSALAGLALLAAAAPLQAQRPSPLEPGRIRVCADPDNMPSSNQKEEGYENKIATLIAGELKSRLEYVWYPTRRGYFRIINGMYCDLAMEAPAGMDMTGVTKPYFRSGYVFVARQGSGLDDVKSLADPRLKKLKIGVNIYTSDAENSPPAMALSHYGVVGNLTGYSTFFDDQNRPDDIVKAVAKRTSTSRWPGARWRGTTPRSRRCRWC